jgi:hypothetical protein
MATAENLPETNAFQLHDELFVLKFTQMPENSRAVEVWAFPDNQNLRPPIHEINDSGVAAWLRADPPTSNNQRPTAGLRLLTQTSEIGYPEFPLKKETLAHLLREWKFPTLQLNWNSFYIGGSAAYVVGSGDCTKLSM